MSPKQLGGQTAGVDRVLLFSCVDQCTANPARQTVFAPALEKKIASHVNNPGSSARNWPAESSDCGCRSHPDSRFAGRRLQPGSSCEHQFFAPQRPDKERLGRPYILIKS